MLYRHVISGELFTDDELKDEFEGLFTVDQLWALDNHGLYLDFYFKWLDENGEYVIESSSD